MRRSSLITLIVLPLAVACGTATTTDYVEPNSLMADEIQNRIAQIPFQHRDELLNNLLWLAQSGEQSIPALLQGLQNTEPKVRSNCCWVLERIHDRRVIPQIQPLLGDSHETVRLEAARSLVLLGDMQPLPLLIEGLDSEKVQVRYLCHEALKSATGRDFNFDHLAEDATARRQAVLQWRQWWGEQSGDPFFAQTYAKKYNLTNVARPPAPSPAPMMETNPSAPRPGTETRTQPGSSSNDGNWPAVPQGQAQPEAPAPAPQGEANGWRTPGLSERPRSR